MAGVDVKAVEPIAVIGMGCRMPGGIRSPSDLWKLVTSKGIANTDKVPSSRFNVDAYLHPNNERPGSFNVPGGYFLEGDPYAFDPSMFNISPIEASWMDPQQRLLLEVVYEAFESSGTPLNVVSGRRTGCFIGSFTQDCIYTAATEPDFLHAPKASYIIHILLTPSQPFVFATLTVNTACSSSMYALDLACKAIYSGECDSAVVGGTNLILTVNQQMNTANMGVLSPTNQCHTFDASADGYGRAEGIGALYLRPLSDALRDGDPIRAVIRSTASGSGKGIDGMTLPSMEGQIDVISRAYRLAGLDPNDTFYVECHGTGTPVGDPIEVNALHQALGAWRPQSSPILIGSVKPNVGHSEAASSMATLMKAVMALEQGLIPPTAGLTKLSPSIPWDDINVQVVSEPTPFPVSQTIKRVGVNAFGYGGTNAHAIIESTESFVPGYQGHRLPVEHQVNGETDNNRPSLLVFSAHDEATLKSNLESYAERCGNANLTDLAYTLGVRRTKLSHRTFTVARKQDIISDIRSAAVDITIQPENPAKLAFVFTGQGAQWAQMGASLLSTFPSVLRLIRQLDEHLSTLRSPPAWKLETMIMSPEHAAMTNEPEFSQPLCTALQIAIVDLLASWNVRPTAAVGHSSGELASAYCSGFISAQKAITLAYYRGKSAQAFDTDGAMLAVGLPADEAKAHVLEGFHGGKVEVACHNSPSNTTLSGDRESIEQLNEALTAKSIFARVLRTGGKAYHSDHMKKSAVAYRTYLDDEPDSVYDIQSRCPMFSTTRAREITSDDVNTSNSYWVENLIQPVLFTQGVQLMLAELPTINTLVEIGPHSALEGPLRQICQLANRPGIAYFPTLKRNTEDLEEILKLAGHLWVNDANIDLHAVTSIERLTEEGEIERQIGSLLVDLPTYQWTYTKEYRSDSRLSKEMRERTEQRHDILGRRFVGSSTLGPTWRNILRQRDLPWLAQHRIGGEVLFPGTGYLALAIEAVTQVNDQSPQHVAIESYTLRDVTISNPTVVPDDDNGTEIQFHLQPLVDGKTSENGSQWYLFTTSCLTFGSWKEAARGRIAINVRGKGSEHTPKSLPSTPLQSHHVDWLDRGRTLGVDLGPVFQHIGDLYTDGKSPIARGEMRVDNKCGLMEAESRYVLHPTVLDACLQITNVSLYKGILENQRCGLIPATFGEITLFSPSKAHLANLCTLKSWTTRKGTRANLSDLQLSAYDDSLLVDISDFRTVEYLAALPMQMQGNLQRDLYLKNEWKPDIDYLDWAGEAGTFSEQPIPTLIDAILHKDVTARILCLEDSLVPSILSVRPTTTLTVSDPSQAPQASPDVKQVVDVTPKVNGIHNTSSGDQESGEKFNIVIGADMEQIDINALEHMRKLLVETGRLLLRTTSGSYSAWKSALGNAGFSNIKSVLPDGPIIATAVGNTAIPNDTSTENNGSGNLLIVYRETPTPLVTAAHSQFAGNGWSVRSQSLDSDLTVREGERVVLLADSEGPLLAQLNSKQLEGLKKIAESTRSIAWVTCGGLLFGDKPEFGMAEGMARVLRNELASLDIVTIDFDTESTPTSRVTSLLFDVVEKQRRNVKVRETEYYVYGGVVYVGRIVPSQELNCRYVPDSGETTVVYQKDDPAISAGMHHGDLRFYQDHERSSTTLLPDEAEIQIAAMGITLLDGSDDADFLNHQIAGTVARIGQAAESIVPGSNVFGFALNQLATFQRTSATLLQALPPNLSMAEAATLPSPFTTALYALENLARIEAGERVVLVDTMGDVLLAALQVCRFQQAEAIIVTSSPTTKQRFMTDSGLHPCQVIDARDGVLSLALEKACAGNGVDVVFCSTNTDSETIAELNQTLTAFSRIVTFGSSATFSTNTARLQTLRPGTSSFHFELADLIRKRPQIVQRLLTRFVSLYSDGHFTNLGSIESRDPMHYNEIIRSSPKTLSSILPVISYHNDTSFQVTSSPRPLKFKPNVTYLLVGGLGGIGRKVTLWMADRGATHLAFVSRSGVDKPAAEELVQLLRDRGVVVSVFRADVTRRQELAEVISQIDPAYPIRGVMNAAGYLADIMFNNMTFDSWLPVIESKFKGQQNLHELLEGHQLDFFVMTSSTSGFMGFSGQTNYAAGKFEKAFLSPFTYPPLAIRLTLCAANTYLDSLARHRRLRGLPAVSLILPAIYGFGYIHEHSLEQSIQQHGAYGIGEKEMLEAFEIAMRPPEELPKSIDHIVMGLQPRQLAESYRKSGAYIALENDMRLNWLGSAIAEQTTGADPGRSSLVADSQDIVTTIRQASSTEEAIDITVVTITRRLARLLMIDEESIQATRKSIASHGLDSMIGAEFRNWIFREFKVEMPFQKLLGGDFTITELAKSLYREIRGDGTA
ncbi:hypothetical protein NUW58_g789 [Xylaria curta]|uniref:Uncharacterized protein n=1 Tax=Xylaria curta TaxID=42375 RepID=A0ACC1PN07_9PEZI|nr:hypothetical protein NUW58_g789 [Xylaria curta]